jgi:hypothetical protein
LQDPLFDELIAALYGDVAAFEREVRRGPCCFLIQEGKAGKGPISDAGAAAAPRACRVER